MLSNLLSCLVKQTTDSYSLCPWPPCMKCMTGHDQPLYFDILNSKVWLNNTYRIIKRRVLLRSSLPAIILCQLQCCMCTVQCWINQLFISINLEINMVNQSLSLSLSLLFSSFNKSFCTSNVTAKRQLSIFSCLCPLLVIRLLPLRVFDNLDSSLVYGELPRKLATRGNFVCFQ